MELWHVRWRREQLQKRWLSWINLYLPISNSGAKVDAPRQLGSPADAGFYAIPIAHPVGQSRDWGLSLQDGSRVHIHELPDGRLIAHRDKHDPAQGLDRAMAHLMHETPYLRWLALAGLVGLVVKAFSE